MQANRDPAAFPLTRQPLRLINQLALTAEVFDLTVAVVELQTSIFVPTHSDGLASRRHYVAIVLVVHLNDGGVSYPFIVSSTAPL